MGVVYRATDLRLQRTVALKLLRATALGDPVGRERFLREARAASALNHPNIVTVHEVDSEGETDFIAMEYVEGVSLAQRIGGRGMAWPEALDLALQIGGALAHAHRAGLVHRDLKPANVMLTPEGRAKVLDFGLAKQVGGPGFAEAPTQAVELQTAAGVVMGTPRYMSPEQAQGRSVDARSDIFSFGALLYEMLAGEPPFSGDNPTEILAAILRDTPRPLGSRRPELPTGVEAIVAKALEKDPARRHQCLEDLLADLQGLAGGSVAGVSGVPPRGRAWRGWGITGLVAIIAGFVLVRQMRSPPTAAPTHFHLLSTFPGSHRSPSLSPDGSMVAFLSSVEGTAQVFVKQLAGGEPVQITFGSEAAERPRWSPRNDQIVFGRAGGLWSAPPLGGAARLIVESGKNPNFSPDGKRLVFEDAGKMWIVASDGSDPQPLEGVPRSYYTALGNRFPTFSPDGRSLAFLQPTNGPTGHLWVLPLPGGPARRLDSTGGAQGAPVWMPDGRSIVYPSIRGGSLTLWRVGLGGGEPEPVTTGAGEDGAPAVSADGKKLVYVNARTTYALVIDDPRTGARREVTQRRTPMALPAVSPSGDRIAYFTIVDGHAQVFTVGVDGSGSRQLTTDDARHIVPSWSADGSTVFFYQSGPAGASFRRVPALGGPSHAVVEGWRWERENGAQVDPTGSRIVYSVLDPPANLRATRIRTLEGGREITLDQPLFHPQWSPGGDQVVGFTQKEALAVCPARPGPCRPLAHGYDGRWSRDGSRIYFLRTATPVDDPTLVQVEVRSVASEGGDEKVVTQLGPVQSLARSFDLTPRAEIVWIQVRRERHELWMADLPGS